VTKFRLGVYNRNECPGEIDLRLDMFRAIFPNVKEFHGWYPNQFQDILELLCTWSKLESIDIPVTMVLPGYNFDHVFTGLTPYELYYVARRPDAIDLRSLQIVPNNPCILNLGKLKRMNILVLHPRGDFRTCSRGDEYRDPADRNRDFLSHLTRQLCFEHVPDLEVNIRVQKCSSEFCCMYLDHLKQWPCVTVSEC